MKSEKRIKNNAREFLILQSTLTDNAKQCLLDRTELHVRWTRYRSFPIKKSQPTMPAVRARPKVTREYFKQNWVQNYPDPINFDLGDWFSWFHKKMWETLAHRKNKERKMKTNSVDSSHEGDRRVSFLRVLVWKKIELIKLSLQTS